jgi:hypothetical protein
MKGYRKMNVVEILCKHLCKMEKWDLSKLFQEWGGGIKENDGGGEFNYWYIVKTFVNVHIPPSTTIINQKNYLLISVKVKNFFP